jgi:thioredoxin 1
MISFESHIKGTKPVVVDFSATWCQPCKLMEPVLHELKEKVGDRATILKLDVDKSPFYTELYNIHSVPTLLIFKEGEIIWRKSGITPAHEILEQLKWHIS